MTTPEEGPGPLQPSAEAEQAALYETLGAFLQGLLIRAFEVPEREAERLVRDTFLHYVQNKPAPNAHAWLIWAACRKANEYRHGRGLPAANEDHAIRNAATALPYRDGMGRLPTRAQEALRLKFEQKKTYEEVAGEMGLSVSAAKRYVAKALAQLRGLLRGEGEREP